MADLLLSALGYLILRLRYPNKEKRATVFEETYNNNYLNVGSEPILKGFGIIFFIVLFTILIAVIYSIFVHGPSE